MTTFQPRLPSLLSATALAAIATLTGACEWNEVETGRNGLVEFVPDDCGQVNCDLDDRLAVGAVTDIYLDGVDGAAVDDLHLESSAPWIVDIVAEDLGGISPRFKIIGNEAGRADLIAVDRWGYAIDYIPIEIAPIDDVELSVTGERVVGPHATAEGPDQYDAGAGDVITIDVSASSRGYSIMGAYSYDYTIVGDFPVAQQPESDGARGLLVFTAPAGEYTVTFTAPGEMAETIFLSVR